MIVEQEVAAAPQNRTATKDSAAQLREVEPMVRAICRRRLGEVDGDDASQRALLRIWQKLESEDGVNCLPSYAATIAKYEALSSYRDFQRTPTPSGDLSEQLWADTSPGPVEQTERVDEIAHARERVEALLAQLTPRQVEVMRASVLAGRTNADAAAELGMSQTALRTAQVRAMARMRELSGTQSPNPLASNLTLQERRHRTYEGEKARKAARQAADGDGSDPLAQAKSAVEALDTSATATAETATDPMGRARTAIDGLMAAVDDADVEALAPTELDEFADADVLGPADDGTDSAGAA